MSTEDEAAPQPYEIAVSDELLSWINDRVRTARIPPGKDLPDKELNGFGLPETTARKIRDYWVDKYDWRAVEKQLNADLKQFTVTVEHGGENHNVHFVHHRSPRPNAVPMLFLHGWPGSFLEVRPIIRKLTHPETEDQQAFHVVAPSLVGYGFSSHPKKVFGPSDQAAVMHTVMMRLGYKTFMVQGGDWGSAIARILALDFPETCPAVHVNLVMAEPPSPLWSPFKMARVMIALTTGYLQTSFEAQMVKRMVWWQTEESGYSQIQGTKPQTLQYAMSDSPLGLLCWIREKIGVVVDDDFEWTEEESITLAMPYIINGTAGHAELYKFVQGAGLKVLLATLGKMLPRSSSFGASIFPKDVIFAHKWWAEAKISSNIVFWKEHDKGGHFPSMEKPDELAEDLRTFVGKVDGPTRKKLRQQSV